MTTICISIGNSDNKLTQMEWSAFVSDLDKIIQKYEATRHFFGGSVTWAAWQNVMWCCELPTDSVDEIKRAISLVRIHYRQDAAFILYGSGEFV